MKTTELPKKLAIGVVEKMRRWRILKCMCMSQNAVIQIELKDEIKAKYFAS